MAPRRSTTAQEGAMTDGSGADAQDTSQVEDLEDAPANPDAVSAAPPRVHQSLVDQLELKWGELKNFVAHLEGDVGGELGEVLAFVRSKL